MSVECTEDAEARVVELTLSGRIGRCEYGALIARLQSFIDRHGRISLIEVIHDFDGADYSVLWQGMKFDYRNFQNIDRVAVVSDDGWISPAAKAAGALLSTRLRTFSLNHLEAARIWVRGKTGGIR